jgi:glycosyltransferase involved in cell wall biosynthesis
LRAVLKRALQRLVRPWRDEHRTAVDRHLDRLYESAGNHEERLRRVEANLALTTWIEHAVLRHQPLISVVMPTRDRAELLADAIESVRASAYPNWELLVADDGSTDGTAEIIAARAGEDSRIRHLLLQHGGEAAARNAALTAAGGALIAYLDDDNRMHPLWLKAVAWAFEQRSEADVLYGGWVIDDPQRLYGGEGGAMPALWLTPFDRGLQAEQPLADQSAIAHRAGLREARFDETLAGSHDWDLLARLTRERDPIVLPMVACLYATDAAARISTRESYRESREVVREKVKALYVPPEPDAAASAQPRREDANE